MSQEGAADAAPGIDGEVEGVGGQLGQLDGRVGAHPPQPAEFGLLRRGCRLESGFNARLSDLLQQNPSAGRASALVRANGVAPITVTSRAARRCSICAFASGCVRQSEEITTTAPALSASCRTRINIVASTRSSSETCGGAAASASGDASSGVAMSSAAE